MRFHQLVRRRRCGFWSGGVRQSSDMALSKERAEGVKGSRVWLGDGLGPVPKKMYEMYKIMARWEFVDLAELKVKSW